MQENPYKYAGPLAPVEDDLVCVSRSRDVKQVFDGIMRGDYWAIMGPRQIGKTTFLNLIKNQFVNAHYVYLDFTDFAEEENPYEEVCKALSKHVPSEQEKSKSTGDCKTASKFIDFLENFKPKEGEKIIFLFDEIDELPSIKTFLDTWRKIFNVRLHQTTLKRYSVITTGAENLIKKTIGKNSPFNIAKTLYIKDFSDKESEKLIDEPFKKLGIEIEPGAKKYLMSQISGHPQILQHACYLLVEKAISSNSPITRKNVEDAIEILLENSSNLATLREDITRNKNLRDLVKDILNGKKKKFFPHSEFSTFGVGGIIKRDSFCAIRNEVYRKFITDILPESSESVQSPEETLPPKWQTPMIISAVLSIIIGFISYLTKNTAGLWAAGILALTVLILFIFKK
jgi:hypothetical protein